MLSGLTFGNKKDLEKQFKEQAEIEKAKKREEKRLSKKQKKVGRGGAEVPAAGGMLAVQCMHTFIAAAHAAHAAGEQEAQEGETQEGQAQAAGVFFRWDSIRHACGFLASGHVAEYSTSIAVRFASTTHKPLPC